MNRTPLRVLAAGVAVVAIIGAGCSDDDETATTDSEPTAESSDSTEAAAGELEITGAWARTSAMNQANGAAYMEVTSPVDDAIVGASVPAEIAATVELHETVAVEDAATDDSMADDTTTSAAEGGDMGGDTTTSAAEGGDMGGDTTTSAAEGGDMGGDTTTSAAEGGDMGGDTTTSAAEGGDMAEGAMTMQPVEKIELPAGETVALEPGGLHIMLLELAAPLEIGQTFTVTLELESGDSVDVEVEVSDEAP